MVSAIQNKQRKRRIRISTNSMSLTGKERITAIMNHDPVDRVGIHEAFWPEVLEQWRVEGHLGENESACNHFDSDIGICGAIKTVADVEFKSKIIDETDEHQLIKDGNGAILRIWKNRSGTPEHYDFAVKNRETYEKQIKHLIKPGKHRLQLDAYKQSMTDHKSRDRYIITDLGGPFSASMHLCGTENLLMGMALDHRWVSEMFKDYCNMFIGCLEILFEKEEKPDAVWIAEDMGFKEKPFFSPTMYRELLFPLHKKLCDFIHSHGVKVVMHSCGFVQTLLPDIIETGIDCLQALEVKAGNDSIEIKKQYGEKIVLCGAMDARAIISNDKKNIKKELDSKLKALMENSGYILHSDHAIPIDVEYGKYKYFMDEGLAIGTY